MIAFIQIARIAHLEVILWHNVPFCGIRFHLVLLLRSNVTLGSCFLLAESVSYSRGGGVDLTQR